MTLEDLYRLLCSGHVQAQGIVDTIRSPLLVLDSDFRIASANTAFLETFRLDSDSATGASLFEIGEGEWDIPELRRLLADIIPKSSAIVGYELSGQLPGKGARNLLINARRLAHPDNNSPNILLEIEDITDSRRAAATKDILLEETRHRMRNLLAVVSSLANQTRTEGRNAEEYRNAFLGRLQSVLHAQEFGGADGADLQTLVNRALAAVGPRRVRLQPGPKVDLQGTQVLPFNLILHELATNALKYGALSVEDGVVHIGWKVIEGAGRQSDGSAGGADRTLHLLWREEGGPPVLTPNAAGFGTRLIQFSAGGDLRGKAELEFAPQGLRAQISALLG